LPNTFDRKVADAGMRDAIIYDVRAIWTKAKYAQHKVQRNIEARQAKVQRGNLVALCEPAVAVGKDKSHFFFLFFLLCCLFFSQFMALFSD
jgi:hypothetical protein